MLPTSTVPGPSQGGRTCPLPLHCPVCELCSDGSLPKPLPCLTCQRNQHPHAGVRRSSFNPGDDFQDGKKGGRQVGWFTACFPLWGLDVSSQSGLVRPGEQPTCMRHLPGPGACVGPPAASSGAMLLPRRKQGQSHVPPRPADCSELLYAILVPGAQ